MFDGLFVVSLVGSCVQIIKELFEPTIPVENWGNKELIHKDKMNGISDKELNKNLANGKYKQVKVYPKPHRDSNGKIIIENSLQYKDDVKKYGTVQAQTWVKQGKYNLTSKELEKEKERVKKEFEYLYSLL